MTRTILILCVLNLLIIKAWVVPLNSSLKEKKELFENYKEIYKTKLIASETYKEKAKEEKPTKEIKGVYRKDEP